MTWRPAGCCSRIRRPARAGSGSSGAPGPGLQAPGQSAGRARRQASRSPEPGYPLLTDWALSLEGSPRLSCPRGRPVRRDRRDRRDQATRTMNFPPTASPCGFDWVTGQLACRLLMPTRTCLVPGKPWGKSAKISLAGNSNGAGTQYLRGVIAGGLENWTSWRGMVPPWYSSR